MKNPYESPQANSAITEEEDRGDFASAVNFALKDWKSKSAVLCFCVTLVSVPMWFVGLIGLVSSVRPIDNPVGIPFYFRACVILAAPAAAINALVLSPLFTSWVRYSRLAAIASCTIVFLISLTSIYGWWLYMHVAPPQAVGWSIIPWYLSIFLVPPCYAGSLAYCKYLTPSRTTPEAQ